MRVVKTGVLTLLLTACVFAQTSREVFELKGQIGLSGPDEKIVYRVPLNDGNKLLLVGRNQLQFWDVASGKMTRSAPHKIEGFWPGALGFLRETIDIPNAMEVSRDGRKGILAVKIVNGSGEKQREAVVWNLETGERLAVLNRPLSPIRTANFSEDGSTIITIHGELKDAQLSFWNAADLTQRGAITVRDLSFYQLSRDGEHVFISSAKANKWMDVALLGFESSKGIELRNTRTGKLEKTYTDGDIKFWNPLNAGPSVSPDEKYLVARNEANKLVVWETAGGGAPKYQIGGDGDPEIKYRLVGISDDSRYLLARKGKEALIYEMETGKLYRKFGLPWESEYTLSPDSKFAIRQSDGWVGIYDLESEKAMPSYNLRSSTSTDTVTGESTTSTVERAKISPDLKFIMIYGYRDVRIYDIATGEMVQTLIDPQLVKYKKNGTIKDSGLDSWKADWLAAGDTVYVQGRNGKSLFLWNKK
jgi:hypothetical protein